MDRSRVAETLIVVILAAIVVFVIADLAGGIGDFPNERWAAAIAGVCLAAWIGPRALARYRGDAGGALTAIAVWLGLACAAALLYVYGQEYLVALGFNV